ncbi:transglycosylase domain-containing protein [Radiobacillus sp. PE A8.2]|uniref:transglycosylase domain-containing protein n=1 Tax=Radiobacillus sp. PE A8.2 TaxID=3380349 RepID=UPI00388F12D4
MNLFKYLPNWASNIKWLVFALVVTILLGLLGYVTILFGGRFIVDEKAFVFDTTSTIETEDGVVLASFYHENRTPVTIEQIPVHVQDAFIAIEDQRFRDHAGVDFTSVMRALYRDITAMGKVEGASTITQQLAKNMFLQNDKTWMRKTKEVMAAIYLERHYSKNKILEFYLNEIYFAHGNYGVETASQFYFSKSIEDVTVSEAALLAALAKAPNNYTPVNYPDKAKQRRDVVLQQMNRMDMISTEEMLELQGRTLGLNLSTKAEKPWLSAYIDAVVTEAEETYQLTRSEIRRGGYRIIATIDEKAQKTAYQLMQKQEYYYGSTEGVEASFILMDQNTGGLEAIIGGRSFAPGELNRAFVKRQPGSTMKPLAVYGPAMMLDEYQPYSIMPDDQRDYDGYSIKNVDGVYSGNVTMYDAIRQSKNAPAVWLLDQIGVPYAKDYLSKMDMTIPDNGLAIALGGLEEGLTPVQLAEGYRTFIHDGEWIDAHTITRIYDRNNQVIVEADPQREQVFSPQVAWNSLRMLESVVDSGTAETGDFAGALAGKTGTTQHPRVSGGIKDAWFVGFTPNYVSALWMGYDYSDEAHYLTKGSSAPTVLTKRILSELGKQEAMPTAFEKPANVEELPEPIELPVISDLEVKFKLGGLPLVRGELTWTAGSDNRIVYQIFQKTDTGDIELGQVTGESSYTISRVNVFQENTYYVVPYDPITKQQGTPSNAVVLSLTR